jgi:hypothetical protein
MVLVSMPGSLFKRLCIATSVLSSSVAAGFRFFSSASVSVSRLEFNSLSAFSKRMTDFVSSRSLVLTLCPVTTVTVHPAYALRTQNSF